MARERWTCRSGHDNAPGAVVCTTCCAFAPGSPSTRLVRAAADFRAVTVLYMVLLPLLALVVGFLLSRVEGCDEYGVCGTQIDGWRFVAITAAVFGVGMLLVVPLRAMALLLMGVARLLTEVEANRS